MKTKILDLMQFKKNKKLKELKEREKMLIQKAIERSKKLSEDEKDGW